MTEPDILLALKVLRSELFGRVTNDELDAAIAEIEKLRAAVELANGMIERAEKERNAAIARLVGFQEELLRLSGAVF